MKKFFNYVGVCTVLVTLSSCFGQHNHAPNPGVNLNSKRIYGPSREAEPVQLKNEYEKADAELLMRMEDIRNKLYKK
ncbi:hypothetical protein KMW28_13960 [Flammeovirga yaeyamensis]|uniref:Lipoprotein n=1 Tax=Flammeovirga yaeyamensis TaxID=367791 RepID=A0AAX1N050_9BACT|nr:MULTISPECIES: hypothetical protein [Flammeovirga]ANQ47839.1 hypothetical protein MY04_0457 [Flammeovirga sp. MY04]QWG00756.1 hypothetical protein KMW28_13960 [Flammeovirga yaeyamensis]